MGYGSIATLLGISRQRVHQIYMGYKTLPKTNKTFIKKENGETIEIKMNERIFNSNFPKVIKIPKLADFFVKNPIKEGAKDRVREFVRIRDNHTCKICLRKWKVGKRRFDVHHLDEEREGKSSEKGVAKWDKEHTNRMITLCHKCHFNLDSVSKKMKVSKNRPVCNSSNQSK